MGIITADLIFALLITLGFSQVNLLIRQHQLFISIINILFLSIFLFVQYFKIKRLDFSQVISKRKISRKKEYKKSLLLCLSNPSTILTFLMLFNILQISQSSNSMYSIFWIVSGLVFGAVLVWVIIIHSVENFGNNFTQLLQRIMPYLSTALIFGLLMFSAYHFYEQYQLSAFIPQYSKFVSMI
jgi:threonine/homoserine/homoserine lactone efflux protein